MQTRLNAKPAMTAKMAVLPEKAGSSFDSN
jgi:hypothetical protein